MKTFDDLAVGQTVYLRRHLKIASGPDGVRHTPPFQRCAVVEARPGHVILQVCGGLLDGEILRLEADEFPSVGLLNRAELRAFHAEGRRCLERAAREDRRRLAMRTLVSVAAALTATNLCCLLTHRRSLRAKRGRGRGKRR